MLRILGRPWDVYLAQNQVANRFVMDTFNTGTKTAIARNNDERIEKLISYVGWLVIGIAMPAVFEYVISRKVGRAFRTAKQGNPVKLPFELLEAGALKKLLATPTDKMLNTFGIRGKAELAKEYGLNNISDLTPAMVKKLRRTKVGIMFIDLFMTGVKGNLVYSIRNWFTKKNSGKAGFVGEFNYTNDAFREKKAEKYEKEKKQRKAISIGLSMGSAIALTALVMHALKSKNTAGVTGWMKKHVSKLNYVDAIFMSRWQIFYQALFNYEIPKLMAARDSHEFRENIIELGIFNAFYFVGDSAIAGWLAKRLQTKNKGLIGGLDLTKPFKLFGKQLRTAKSYGQVYKEVGKQYGHPAYKAAKKVFFTGLLGSSIGLSLATLGNYALTRYKASKEQAVFNQKLVAPLQRLMDATQHRRLAQS